MEHRPAPMDPAQAEQQFGAMLEEAGLPRFTRAHHDPDIDELQLVWDHGFTLHIDLTRRDQEPIDDWERAAILGLPHQCEATSRATPPRSLASSSTASRHSIPTTSRRSRAFPSRPPSRTLIDPAEVMTTTELRAAFARAQEIGLHDPDALRAARARVEWRPSLAMLDEVIDEFCN